MMIKEKWFYTFMKCIFLSAELISSVIISSSALMKDFMKANVTEISESISKSIQIYYSY
jgi:hypothetical protein